MRTQGLPERLKQWRTWQGLSYRRFQRRINKHLPENLQISFATLNDWEQPGASGPRAGVLEALLGAFPDLRLEWLLFGDGPATKVEQAMLDQVGVVEYRCKEVRVPTWPSLHELPQAVRSAFFALLVRVYRSFPDAPGDADSEEGQAVLDSLALDLQTLLLLPAHTRGFHAEGRLEASNQRQLEDYGMAMLHALSLLVPKPGEGEHLSTPHLQLLEAVRTALPEFELLGNLMVRRGATLARGDERLEAAADVAEVAEVAVRPGDPPASGGLRRVSFPRDLLPLLAVPELPMNTSGPPRHQPRPRPAR